MNCITTAPRIFIDVRAGINGSVINLRDASVICAGMFFGLPGGIIAGLIGGVERLLAAYVWGSAGSFTTIACSLTTLLAGTAAGVFGSRVFAKKNPMVVFALAIGIVTELIHCGLVLLFKLRDLDMAWSIVKCNALPLIISNTISILAAVLLVKYLGSSGTKQ